MDYALDTRRAAAPRMRRSPRSRPAWSLHTDSELLLAIAGGDRHAFEELHHRYSRAMLGFALHRLRDRGRAEDAVQDVFTSIWRAAATYQPERGSGSQWIYGVARNAITSKWRKRVEPAVEPLDEPSDEPGPPEQVEANWRSFAVHRALQSLPDHQRPLIELAYWGDLSQSEIAERLDLPLGTVKTRTRAALKRLADVLKDDMQ
jgi:RNA polymerase sigma-70 factor (ECF subfamily)